VRSVEDVREVFRLARLGLSISAIARRVGLSRATIRNWLGAGEPAVLTRLGRQRDQCGLDTAHHPTAALVEPAYAYLLGQYLGDGCISRIRSSFRLRIVCCDAYPRIRDECAEAIRLVRRDGRVGFVHRQGCTEVSNYWLHWPCLLPHGEGGLKHTRAIELAPWQREIALDHHPGLFVRGLIHSDGWRGTNRVRGANGSRYAYPRYQFSNRSADIKALFVEACDRLGVEVRPMNGVSLSVAKRRSVEILDSYVGAKE
jgi:hypothetical protein